MVELDSVQIWGLRVDEPVVTLTDLLVAVVCFYGCYKIHLSGKPERIFTYFKYYFLLMGIATTLGGLLGHAFLYAFSFAWKLPGWVISMFAIMLIERGTIEHTRILLRPQAVKILGIINIIELSIFLVLTLTTLNFFFVEFHSGYGLMFVVLSLEGLLYIKTKNTASKYIIAGMGFAALAAVVFMSKFTIHFWFNHLSLSHVLMAVAAWFVYLGVAKIEMKHGKVLAH